ncbi:MAG: carboxypeptidase regulatory-like domain-containing protein [Pedosphaera sp.]|nr:carboxypeptidase regulatory-like domain-containing protein [Pedosphaera sp.]
MRAVILVLDTPVFTKTDREGKYRLVINNVPDGRYVLKAWADEKNIQQQAVELKEGSKLKVDFPGK